MSNKLKSLTINLLKNLLIELNDNNINSRNIVNDNINDINNILLKDISNNLSVFYTEISLPNNLDLDDTILSEINIKIKDLNNNVDKITANNINKQKIDNIKNFITLWNNSYQIIQNFSTKEIKNDKELCNTIIPIVELCIINIKKILRL
tara:strand:+ start:62 stop:511 length:450 start_codon:yes stop_codon:yes gene_type:complete